MLLLLDLKGQFRREGIWYLEGEKHFLNNVPCLEFDSGRSQGIISPSFLSLAPLWLNSTESQIGRDLLKILASKDGCGMLEGGRVP